MNDLNKVLTESEVRQFAPLTIAYYGDCVYEQLVRKDLLLTADMPVHALHDRAVEMVCAAFQAKAARFIKPVLTEDELYYFNRGRNSSHIGIPRSSNSADYRAATGLETLFGYLSLAGKTERMIELFREVKSCYETAEKR